MATVPDHRPRILMAEIKFDPRPARNEEGSFQTKATLPDGTEIELVEQGQMPGISRGKRVPVLRYTNGGDQVYHMLVSLGESSFAPLTDDDMTALGHRVVQVSNLMRRALLHNLDELGVDRQDVDLEETARSITTTSLIQAFKS